MKPLEYFKITARQFFNFGDKTPLPDDAPERYCKRHQSQRRNSYGQGVLDANGKYFDYVRGDGECVEITKEEYEYIKSLQVKNIEE